MKILSSALFCISSAVASAQTSEMPLVNAQQETLTASVVIGQLKRDIPVRVLLSGNTWYRLPSYQIVDLRYLDSDGKYKALLSSMGAIEPKFEPNSDVKLAVSMWSSDGQPTVRESLNELCRKNFPGKNRGFLNFEKPTATLVFSTEGQGSDGDSLQMARRAFRRDAPNVQTFSVTVPGELLNDPLIREPGGLQLDVADKYKCLAGDLLAAVDASVVSDAILKALSQVSGDSATGSSSIVIPLGGGANGVSESFQQLIQGVNVQVLRGQKADGVSLTLFNKVIEELRPLILKQVDLNREDLKTAVTFMLSSRVTCSTTIGELSELGQKDFRKTLLSTEEYDKVFKEGKYESEWNAKAKGKYAIYEADLAAGARKAQYSRDETERLRKRDEQQIRDFQLNWKGKMPVATGIDLSQSMKDSIKNQLNVKWSEYSNVTEATVEVVQPVLAVAKGEVGPEFHSQALKSLLEWVKTNPLGGPTDLAAWLRAQAEWRSIDIGRFSTVSETVMVVRTALNIIGEREVEFRGTDQTKPLGQGLNEIRYLTNIVRFKPNGGESTETLSFGVFVDIAGVPVDMDARWISRLSSNRV